MKARLTGLSREQQLVETNHVLAKQLLEAKTCLQNKDNELTNLKKELENKQEISRKVINQLREENRQSEEQIEKKEQEITSLKQQLEEIKLSVQLIETH